MAAAFRLMTCNLLHERCDPSDFARVLTEHDPDVVVTQELGPEPARILTGVYPHHQLRPRRDFLGRGIATRFDAVFGDIDMPGRDGTSALLDVDGIEVRLAGIHLLNPIDFPWWASVRTRRRQLDGLLAWLEAGSGPTLVAGDCNASPSWPAYKHLADRLTDLVVERSADDGTRAEPTWAWRPGWPRLLRLDHVFGSGIRATRVVVLPIAGSDHHAVIVDLQIP